MVLEVVRVARWGNRLVVLAAGLLVVLLGFLAAAFALRLGLRGNPLVFWLFWLLPAFIVTAALLIAVGGALIFWSAVRRSSRRYRPLSPMRDK
ncbi:MAG: hypothetical protein HY557_08865 [Euryarchaeota archaeon]|nr:hypothetical protein [Euryarchaeota archaeon]